MTTGRLRLLAPAATCWALTSVLVMLPGAALWAALGAAALGFGCGVAAFRGASRWRTPFGVLAIGCALLMLLGTRVAVIHEARTSPLLAEAAESGAPVKLRVALSSYPEVIADSWGGERGWVRGHPFGAATPLLLFLDGAPQASLGPGSRVEVRGVLRATPPGDAAAFTMRVLDLTPIAETPAHLLDAAAAAARAAAIALREGLRHTSARVPGAELVPGFAVGDTALVPAVLEQAMLESSLVHLTAVSGANCALVTAAVIWAMSRCGVGRRWRLVVAAMALGAFVGVVGPDPSVQRAAVMAAVLLIGGFGGRRAAALPALGLAIAVLLLGDPWQALQPGFALSVVATGGILIWATPCANWMRRRLRMPRWLALPIGVAVAAQLSCGPLLLLLQPGIPMLGVLANVLAAPAAPLGTGLGLIAGLVIPFSEPLGHAAVLLASAPARWVAATAEVTAALPLARWSWPQGWAGALLLAGCQAALLLAWALHRGHLGLPGGTRTPRRAPWQPAAAPPIPIRLAVAVLTWAAIGVVVAITCITPLGDRLRTPGDWAVVACDIGQGDAMLLRDPARPDEVMLVDTGDDPEKLTACLDRFGVHRIALLVLSHDDRDHVGALTAVAERVDAALIAPAAREQRGEVREVVRRLEAAGVPARIATAGMHGGAGAEAIAPDTGLRWEVLAPEPAADPADTNAASIVLRVAAGATRVLLLGDTGRDEQRALLARGVDLGAEVLKVSHHGSRDQDQRLAARVGAPWAVISVGAGNGYGHPAAETLAALAQAGTRTLRTDRFGSIALSPGAAELQLWVERVAGSGDGGQP